LAHGQHWHDEQEQHCRLEEDMHQGHALLRNRKAVKRSP
jgi:hypothetical protein